MGQRRVHGSSQPTARQYKMFRPLFYAPLAIALVLLQQVPTASSTFAISAVSLLSLTAAQTTALAAVAILGIKAKLIGAYLLSQRGSNRRGVRRGKRSAEVENPQVENVLALFNPQQFMQAPLSHKAMKFVE